MAALELSRVTPASVIATAAPMAAEPPVALPSAVDDACARPPVDRVSAAPALTGTMPSVARADALTTDTATAAAMLTPPCDVEACGVAGVSLEPVVPLADAALSACERSPATWPSMPPAGAELVPPALAVAVDETVDGAFAVSVIAPPACSDAWLDAKAVWFAKVSATDAPIAAVPPVVSPVAVVLVVAFVAEVKVMAPRADCTAPALFAARVATLSIATATAGATLTPPPKAPVFADVVVVFVADASSVKSFAREVAKPVANSATVVMFTMSSATDAPTPTDPAPVVAASAFAPTVELECAASVRSPSPTFAPPVTVAFVLIEPITRANEPARPTPEPPLAPLFACAARSCAPV